jgi:hypothetical protein
LAFPLVFKIILKFFKGKVGTRPCEVFIIGNTCSNHSIFYVRRQQTVKREDCTLHWNC